MARVLKPLAASIALALLLVACGDSDGEASDLSRAPREESADAPAAFDGGDEAVSMADSEGLETLVVGLFDDDGDGSGGSGTVAEGREIIRTANLHIRAQSIPQAVAEASALASSHGGFVSSQQVELESDPFATITLRVPSGDFDSLLSNLGKLGALLSQSVASQDVTAEFIDLESRIASAEISVGRLRGFLSEAKSVTDIASLEAELSRRESNLEAMKGQLRSLADRVSLTTVTVTFTSIETPEVIEPDEETSLAGFTDGLDAGVGTILIVGSLLAALAGLVLPFTPFAVVAGGLYALKTRRMSQ